ncbi:glycosyltransferase [Pseudarthrobacter sp. J75]|uniref:glycosyltransferase family 2 protein n=1 Tax=unclassified Pseudarthrobacter TaxID=2647000 RepID=UPI002E813B01|nr:MULTISPECIES: glycosyltransferase [unclassified Pseudarthrobacter]MEE2524679.1 glycosyltransferase [Pseudarthrobacter sp. J47]MEE2528233.1 glycosyltransferase [Pseudarthrobacter sp. J75]
MEAEREFSRGVPLSEALRVSVVIPSLKPGASLLRLLRSLESQSFRYQQIVIVDQSNEQLAQDVLRRYQGHLVGFIEVVMSMPGLSRARNRGLRSLRDGWELVLVPDDDVWLAGDASTFLTTAVKDGVVAGSGRLRPEQVGSSSRIGFPDTGREITQRTIWRNSIEACYFFTPDFFTATGYYDETLGLGSATPWLSGEGTDLLLRGISRAQKVAYVPGYELIETTRPTLSAAENSARLRNYARGTGRVFARNYAVLPSMFLICRSLIKVVAQAPRGPQAISDNWNILIGRIEGLLGRVL